MPDLEDLVNTIAWTYTHPHAAVAVGDIILIDGECCIVTRLTYTGRLPWWKRAYHAVALYCSELRY